MRCLLLALLLTGCADVFGPPSLQIKGSTVLAEPVRLDALWNRLVQCSGLHSMFPAPEVYLAPTANVEYEGSEASGRYFSDGRRVFIGITRIYDDRLILHEFMHALSGHRTHDPKYFNGACGDLIHVNTLPPL